MLCRISAQAKSQAVFAQITQFQKHAVLEHADFWNVFVIGFWVCDSNWMAPIKLANLSHVLNVAQGISC